MSITVNLKNFRDVTYNVYICLTYIFAYGIFKPMIKSFHDQETEKIYKQQKSRKLPVQIQERALKKLIILDNAVTENDLRIPPSNHLEYLKGNRKGECSIRINDQWRLCFRFSEGNAHDVMIEDYHK